MPPSGSARKVASGCRRAKPAGENKSGEKERWAEISRRPAGMWDMPRNAPNCADQAMPLTEDWIVGDAIGLIHDSVKEGESVVTPMSSSKLFPPMVISMVDVGEETGQLPDMLLKIADVYDDEVDNAVGAMTSMLEPIMIVFLAVVVGGIVFAMFLPLLQVIEKMG